MKKLIARLVEYRLFREFFVLVKYGTVGIINTVVTTCIFILLKYLGLGYAAYTAIGYIVGIFLSFFLNRKYTFKKDDENVTRQIVLFFVISATLLSLVQLIQYALIDIYNVKEWVSVASGMVFYTGLGFLLNRNVVFKYRDNPETIKEENNERQDNKTD